jgi:hypothetical protein
MTEADWLAATDPQPMLGFLRKSRGVSERKVRLFDCGCCRRLSPFFPPDAVLGYRVIDLLDKCEEDADGKVSPEEVAWLQAVASELTSELYEELCTTQGFGSGLPWLAAREVRNLIVRDPSQPPRPKDVFGEEGFEEVRGDWLADDSEDVPWEEREPTAEAAREPAEARARANECDLIRDLFGNPFRPAPALAPSVLAWDGGTVVKVAAAVYDERAFDRLPVVADALEDAGCTDAELLGHCRGGGEHVRGCWVVDLVLAKG